MRASVLDAAGLIIAPAIPGANWLAIILAGLLGLCLGSFLNVLIHRLPGRQSLIAPGSRCPHCSRPIRRRDNIPVLSYLLLKGRCRSCGTRISVRYPIIEVLGAACLTLAYWVSDGPGAFAIRSALLLTLLAIAVIDLMHMIIPDELSLTGIAAGVLCCPYVGLPRTDGLLGLAVGAGSLLAIGLVYRRMRGEAGMGIGDIKLAGMLGAFLGWKGVLLSILLASLLGSLIGIALVLARRAHGRTALPFGTFLAVAASLVLLLES